ncbi:site-specific integrase [Pseudotabrizicola sediminis]|uniref:Site-specific integrase n=1 Tax=Pseudotabrizicola sediminis TaxID=2486418 RepID=A0ABY2KRS9_9RHOB|nr:site-specific integrase [Pseudotabrizicola sediminis]TGD45443.1 site-specific integrase [Pseudotabrizicola sediminis]
MSRLQNKLSDPKCRAEKKPGLHSDGGGLYLSVKPTGAKSWAFVWRSSGKRFEMGLGPYPAVGLARARKMAAEHRETIAEGRNPLVEKKREAEPLFSECVEHFLNSMEGQWRNAKHRAQWRSTLATYAAALNDKRVSQVDTTAVLSVLTPIWTRLPETASRLRGRIERVLDYAKAKEWRVGENPALWRGHLKNVLPERQRLSRGHHSALPYDKVGEVVKKLQVLPGVSARALEFLILTASRSGEVREATWSEIDLEGRVWTVPARRMKAAREHRVPLSPSTIAILKRMQAMQISVYVFPGQKVDKPMSVMAYAMLMRRMKLDAYTVHGFRSAFRDWAGDRTDFPREIAEAALAHTVGDSTERAYRRSDALERRRCLMEAWAIHCEGQTDGSI